MSVFIVNLDSRTFLRCRSNHKILLAEFSADLRGEIAALFEK